MVGKSVLPYDERILIHLGFMCDTVAMVMQVININWPDRGIRLSQVSNTYCRTTTYNALYSSLCSLQFPSSPFSWKRNHLYLEDSSKTCWKYKYCGNVVCLYGRTGQQRSTYACINPKT